MALYLNGRDGLLFKTQACNDGNDDLIAHSKKIITIAADGKHSR